MCNTIRNKLGFNSIDVKPSKTSNKNTVVPENNKVDSVIKEELNKDIAKFDFDKKVTPIFLYKNLNFDDKKTLKNLNNFIDNHKNSKPDKNVYVKGLNNTPSGIELLENKNVIDKYLKNKLGISLKDFLLLNYKIDNIENKDLSKALKDKLKYGISNSSKSVLSDLSSELKSSESSKFSPRTPNKQYPKQNEIENIKKGIILNKSKEKEIQDLNSSYIDKTLDFISKNEEHIPYGSKFEIGFEGVVNPLKLAEIGVNSGIKLEYGFGKGPTYIGHINIDAKISSQLGSFSSTMGDYGLAFYDIDGIRKFKDNIYEIINDSQKNLDKKKNDLFNLIKDNSCLLNTQVLELKTSEDSGIKVTNTKGFFKPPPAPDEKSKDEGYYKEELSVNDFEIESTFKNGKIKIQSSDLYSVEKDNSDKPPIIKLSFEYNKDFSKLNISDLKAGIKNLSNAVKSSNIDSKNDILSILDNTLKLIDKNKQGLDNFNKLNKKLSANTSIELNSDKQGVFFNVSNNSEFLKKLEFIKSKIKNLPVSVTPSINFNMGYRQKLSNVKK